MMYFCRSDRPTINEQLVILYRILSTPMQDMSTDHALDLSGLYIAAGKIAASGWFRRYNEGIAVLSHPDLAGMLQRNKRKPV